jgi:hypothetical protein
MPHDEPPPKPGQVIAALYEDPPLFASELRPALGPGIRQCIRPVFDLCAFKHPLTQEVAYRSQLGARRAQLHGAVARGTTEQLQRATPSDWPRSWDVRG